jgi:hypothetical protein
VEAGRSRDFAVPPGQPYDMRALDCNQNTLDEQRSIQITTTVTTWTVGP